MFLAIALCNATTCSCSDKLEPDARRAQNEHPTSLDKREAGSAASPDKRAGSAASRRARKDALKTGEVVSGAAFSQRRDELVKELQIARSELVLANKKAALMALRLKAKSTINSAEVSRLKALNLAAAKAEKRLVELAPWLAATCKDSTDPLCGI